MSEPIQRLYAWLIVSENCDTNTQLMGFTVAANDNEARGYAIGRHRPEHGAILDVDVLAAPISLEDLYPKRDQAL